MGGVLVLGRLTVCGTYLSLQRGLTRKLDELDHSLTQDTCCVLDMGVCWGGGGGALLTKHEIPV